MAVSWQATVNFYPRRLTCHLFSFGSSILHLACARSFFVCCSLCIRFFLASSQILLAHADAFVGLIFIIGLVMRTVDFVLRVNTGQHRGENSVVNGVDTTLHGHNKDV